MPFLAFKVFRRSHQFYDPSAVQLVRSGPELHASVEYWLRTSEADEPESRVKLDGDRSVLAWRDEVDIHLQFFAYGKPGEKREGHAEKYKVIPLFRISSEGIEETPSYAMLVYHVELECCTRSCGLSDKGHASEKSADMEFVCNWLLGREPKYMTVHGGRRAYIFTDWLSGTCLIDCVDGRGAGEENEKIPVEGGGEMALLDLGLEQRVLAVFEWALKIRVLSCAGILPVDLKVASIMLRAKDGWLRAEPFDFGMFSFTPPRKIRGTDGFIDLASWNANYVDEQTARFAFGLTALSLFPELFKLMEHGTYIGGARRYAFSMEPKAEALVDVPEHILRVLLLLLRMIEDSGNMHFQPNRPSSAEFIRVVLDRKGEYSEEGQAHIDRLLVENDLLRLYRKAQAFCPKAGLEILGFPDAAAADAEAMPSEADLSGGAPGAGSAEEKGSDAGDATRYALDVKCKFNHDLKTWVPKVACSDGPCFSPARKVDERSALLPG